MVSRESLWEELERADAQIAQLMGERAQLGAQLSKAWQKSRGLAKELEARERDLEAAERHAEELSASLAKAQASSTVCACAQ
ncbi:hypothetical protein GGF41_004752 [Coemansia sp. RSA 2531]|nr:hypothetical protein GGF41_004752 [Coemansia sp. RSA 2531]